jgi:hypothetical protein
LTNTDFELRTVQLSDTSVLAELMIEPNRGTIDYDDEMVEDATAEVQTYLAGGHGGTGHLSMSDNPILRRIW